MSPGKCLRQLMCMYLVTANCRSAPYIELANGILQLKKIQLDLAYHDLCWMGQMYLQHV